MNSGWYTKIISRQKIPEIRWVTILDFWINFYSNMKEKIPLYCFHISKLEISDAQSECGMIHSINIKTNHNCTLPSIILITPNQFDIIEIKQKILNEQERWSQYTQSVEPRLPLNITMDIIGKFVYRPVDRIKISIEDNKIIIKQLNKEDIIILIDNSFDIHPTLETENDVKWIIFGSNQLQGLRYHCINFEEMKNFVNTCLHISLLN